ncbi:MAG: sulfotransferase family protein [Alphaproteobacteria bacterium]
MFRHATSCLRKLPDVLIIGTEKGGTDTLYAQLAQHPQFTAPLNSSLHYFEENWHKNALWYRAHFPLRFQEKNQITGEKSTFYIYDPRAAERIKKLMPDVKIIALLRDPCDRAISHYFHYKNRGFEDLDIEEAFAKEEERITPLLDNMSETSLYRPGHPLKVYSYKSRGYYAQQIEQYFKHFDKEQIYIAKSEDYFADPLTTLKEIFAFLNIDPNFRPDDLSPRNTGRKREIPDVLYNNLKEHFKPHNAELSKLLGKNFTWD